MGDPIDSCIDSGIVPLTNKVSEVIISSLWGDLRVSFGFVFNLHFSKTIAMLTPLALDFQDGI